MFIALLLAALATDGGSATFDVSDITGRVFAPKPDDGQLLADLDRALAQAPTAQRPVLAKLKAALTKAPSAELPKALRLP